MLVVEQQGVGKSAPRTSVCPVRSSDPPVFCILTGSSDFFILLFILINEDYLLFFV